MPEDVGYGSGKGGGPDLVHKGSKIRTPFKHATTNSKSSGGGGRKKMSSHGSGRYKSGR